MHKSVIHDSDKAAIEEIIERLVKAGVCSVCEILSLCDPQNLVNRRYFKQASEDNPFIGRRPAFQDRIEDAVFGKNS